MPDVTGVSNPGGYIPQRTSEASVPQVGPDKTQQDPRIAAIVQAALASMNIPQNGEPLRLPSPPQPTPPQPVVSPPPALGDALNQLVADQNAGQEAFVAEADPVGELRRSMSAGYEVMLDLILSDDFQARLIASCTTLASRWMNRFMALGFTREESWGLLTSILTKVIK